MRPFLQVFTLGVLTLSGLMGAPTTARAATAPAALQWHATQAPNSQSLGDAIALYKRGQYKNAHTLLLSLPESAVDPATRASYLLLCEIGFLQEDPVKIAYNITQWEQEYPTAPLKEYVYLQWGNALMDRNRYTEARDAYLRIDLHRLPKSQRAQATFKKGYAHLWLQEYPQAREAFELTALQPRGQNYKEAARYYLGYLHYANKEFKEAIPLLEELKRSPKFGQLSTAYLLQSRFYLKQYEEVIREGTAIYTQISPTLQPTLAKVLSESFFALNRTHEARDFFDKYMAGSTGFSRTDNYFSGLLYYALGDYPKAIEQLVQVRPVTDSLGQNALYHLGKAYIETKNKVAALDAFAKASERNYDPVLREDALFNYAKLSFDVNGDITVLDSYRIAYPNSTKLDEIQTYIAANSFVKQDYKGAVDALQSIRKPTPENLRYLLRSAYLRGLQLYRAGSYREALTYFEWAQEPYWEAECLYRNGKYNQAITLWQKYIDQQSAYSNPETYRNAHYNIAYAHFKNKTYEQAQAWFERFLKLGKVDSAYAANSYLRLGDCAFTAYRYDEAAQYYEQALSAGTVHPDYALFQIALTLGLQDDANRKIEYLDRLLQDYPASALYSSALYEKGRTYVERSQYEPAGRLFHTLLDSPTHSAYHAKALVELGLIQLNTNNREAAMTYYKEVMRRFPDSPEAVNALAGIENIYQAQSNARGYFEYLDQLGLEGNKTEDEKESILFAEAEQLYLSQHHPAAVTSLRRYLHEYPKSPHLTAAHFYLAECLRAMGKTEEAADSYLHVMREPNDSFTELATLQYATIQYGLEQYGKAADAYLSLHSLAVLEQNKLVALTGLMEAYYKDKQYRNALTYANEVCGDARFDATQQTRARYLCALSYLALNEREEALPLLEQLARDPHSAIGAEATYLLCKAAFDSGDFEAAEKRIYEFSDSDTPQEYWMAHAFILLGDIYAERGEKAQAQATYESVRDGYHPAEPDNIAQIVALRLKSLAQ